MKLVKDLRNSVKKVFRNKKYFLIFSISSILMFFLYAFIPVFLVPGNDLRFFLETTPLWGLFILIILSLMMGLLISMQVYLFKETKKMSLENSSTGFVAGFSGIISGIFSSATCASCVAALFAFLGTGSITFLLEHRWKIATAGFLLILTSLFITSNNIKNNCKNCGISFRRKK